MRMKKSTLWLSLSLVAAQPGVALAQARSISAADKQAGSSANPKLIAEFGGAYTGPQAAFVERVGRRVAVQSGLSNAGADFTVTTLNSPVENAFAIPGGYIYITRQLLALMNSEAELASVLGHEVGHVAARHSQSRNTRSTIGSILATAAGALTGSDIAGRLVGTGAQLYTLKYGREQEYQADALGIRYMTAAGYNPYASAEILHALDASTNLSAQAAGKSGQSLPTWVSTHPNSEARVQRAAKLAAETGRPDVAAPQDSAFLRMLDGLPYGSPTDKTIVRIVAVKSGDTIDSLAARMSFPSLKRERFVTLNGIEADERIAPGRLVKLIVPAGS
jgi:predicted Zn-dependent protease